MPGPSGPPPGGGPPPSSCALASNVVAPSASARECDCYFAFHVFTFCFVCFTNCHRLHQPVQNFRLRQMKCFLPFESSWHQFTSGNLKPSLRPQMVWNYFPLAHSARRRSRARGEGIPAETVCAAFRKILSVWLPLPSGFHCQWRAKLLWPVIISEGDCLTQCRSCSAFRGR